MRIIEKDKDGYFAYISNLKGYFSQSDSYEEVLYNITEAMITLLRRYGKSRNKKIHSKSNIYYTH